MLNRFKTVFSIDLRTLAFFRIYMGIMILIDLAIRAPYIFAHYTDAGILPREAAMDFHTNMWSYSLYFMNGSPWFQVLMFLITAGTAGLLLLGYRTRIVTIIMMVLMHSLHNRNPFLLNGGDNLIGVLLFWSCFLPLGAKLSVDSALNNGPKPKENLHFSVATIGILIQSMSLYLFTAILKSDDIWFPDGTAVYYALHLDQFAKPFGIWLREFPLITQIFSYAVWLLEYAAPILLFVPVWNARIRIFVLLALASMHLGFHFGLQIGLFSFYSMLSISNFIPGSVWDWFEKRRHKPTRQQLKIFFDGDCGFCRKTALLLRTFLLIPSTVPIRPAQEDINAHALLEQHFTWVLRDHTGKDYIKWQAIVVLVSHSPLFWPLAYILGAKIFAKPGLAFYHFVGNHRGAFGRFTSRYLPYRPVRLHNPRWTVPVVATMIVFVAWWNISSVPHWNASFTQNHILRAPAYLFKLAQYWGMFAPYPIKDDGWFTVRGIRNDGNVVSVLERSIGEPNKNKPAMLSEKYPSARWRKYSRNMWSAKHEQYRLYFGRYLCRTWNTDHDRWGEKLREFKIYYHKEVTLLDYQPSTVEDVLIWEHYCFKAPERKTTTPTTDD